jgi:hypothetical protein
VNEIRVHKDISHNGVTQNKPEVRRGNLPVYQV